MKFVRLCLLTVSIANFNPIFIRSNEVAAQTRQSTESVTLHKKVSTTTDAPDETTELQQTNSDTTIDNYTKDPIFVGNSYSINKTVMFPTSDYWDSFTCQIMNPVVGTIGMILDGIGLAVLSKMDNCRVFHYCLSSLLVLDEIYLALLFGQCLPYYMEPYDMSFTNGYVVPYLESIFTALKLTVFCIYAYIVALMSIERCFVILFPLKGIENPKKVILYFLLVITLLAIGFHSTLVISVIAGDVKKYFDESSNQTLYIMVHSEVNEMKFSLGLIHLLITKVAPLIIIIPCNTVICVVLSKHRQRRAALFSGSEDVTQQTEQLRMTLTLTAISFILCLSLFPLTVGFLVPLVNPERFGPGKQEYSIPKMLANVSFVMQTLSASTDFVIYICSSKLTRDMLISMITKRSTGPNRT